MQNNMHLCYVVAIIRITVFARFFFLISINQIFLTQIDLAPSDCRPWKHLIIDTILYHFIGKRVQVKHAHALTCMQISLKVTNVRPRKYFGIIGSKTKRRQLPGPFVSGLEFNVNTQTQEIS